MGVVIESDEWYLFEDIDIRSLLFFLYVVPLLWTLCERGLTCSSILPSPCLPGSHTRSSGDNVGNSQTLWYWSKLLFCACFRDCSTSIRCW